MTADDGPRTAAKGASAFRQQSASTFCSAFQETWIMSFCILKIEPITNHAEDSDLPRRFSVFMEIDERQCFFEAELNLSEKGIQYVTGYPDELGLYQITETMKPLEQLFTALVRLQRGEQFEFPINP